MKTKLIFSALLFTMVVTAQTKLSYQDLLTSNKPSGTFTSYLSKDSIKFQIGDTITLGSPEGNGGTFNYVKITDGLFTTISAEQESSGYKTQIASIVVKKKNNSFYVIIKTTGKMMTLSAPIYYTVEIEEAIKTGELKTGVYISNEDALAQLKAAKDKLDLGLISTSDYEKKKSQLAKYIE